MIVVARFDFVCIMMMMMMIDVYYYYCRLQSDDGQFACFIRGITAW